MGRYAGVGDYVQKGSALYDVRAYGAKGDGTTDDTAEIQAAVDAAKSYGDPGTVYFPQGHYYISDKITIDRAINIAGCGKGSQIFQSADEHLLYWDTYDDNRADHSTVRDICLASAATTAGKALMYLYGGSGVSDCLFENIMLSGGYDGISLAGDCHRNQFSKIQTFNSPTWHFADGSISANQRWVYAHSVNNNANVFINPLFNKGVWGFYWTHGNVLTIFGGYIEGNAAVQEGCYFSGDKIQIYGLNLETASLDMIFENCDFVTLADVNGQDLTFRNCKPINLRNVKMSGPISIDRRCGGVEIVGTRCSALTCLTGDATIRNQENPSHSRKHPAGVTGRSTRNMVDGSMETFAGSWPLGFSNWKTNQTGAQANATVPQFMNYSARVVVGAGDGAKAGLEVDGVDYMKYAAYNPTSLRSADYQWIAAASGTNEYYLEANGGGDPEVEAYPRVEKYSGAYVSGLMISGAFATEGSIAALATGEWGWGDNDSLGFDTVYIRDNTGDPDAEDLGYVEYVLSVRKFTMSGWFYRETGTGSPYLMLDYASGSDLSIGFTVTTGVWTRLSYTFDIYPGTTGVSPVFINANGSPATNGDISYWAGLQVVESDTVMEIYDDSRGVIGNLSLSGSIVPGSEVSTMAGHETFTASDGNLYIKDPDGAGRNFNPSGDFPVMQVTVINTAGGAETITFDSAGLNQAINQNERGIFAFDGTNWLTIFVG